MKRRNLLMAFGALATGSGAISTTASLTDTVDTSSDIRVINPQDMKLRAGVAFRDDGTVRETDGYGPTESDSDYNYSEYYVENTTFFEDENPSDSEGLKNISESDAPVATVNRRDENTDGEVYLQTAIKLGNWEGNPFYFENILEVENRAGGQQDVGIRYEGYYGDDVNTDDPNSSQELQDELFREDVQQVYKFWVKNDDGDSLISPEPGDNSEDPSEPVTLDPGETVQLDLEINLNKWDGPFSEIDPKKGIRNAKDDVGFSGAPDTVDTLDAIKIGKYTT